MSKNLDMKFHKSYAVTNYCKILIIENDYVIQYYSSVAQFKTHMDRKMDQHTLQSK